MGLKVAIVGLSQSSHNDAPWGDPEWEIWGLPWDEGYWLRMHRLFEVHDITMLQRIYGDGLQKYLERLAECENLYTRHKLVPSAILYPMDVPSGQYMTSSIAYALALAIKEGAEEISLFGVDINENQYFDQRPCLEYLVGFAKGRGIKVNIPDTSLLLKGDLYGTAK